MFDGKEDEKIEDILIFFSKVHLGSYDVVITCYAETSREHLYRSNCYRSIQQEETRQMFCDDQRKMIQLTHEVAMT